MGQRLAEAAPARVRAGHAGMEIAVARAGHRQIDGEEQARALDLAGDGEQLGHVAAVA